MATEIRDHIVDVEALTTVFRLRRGDLRAVNAVNLSVRRGEIVGLVGESGSGKSVTGLSIMGLVDPPGFIDGGRIRFDGQDITAAAEERLRQLRGNRMALIFQDAMMALNPVLTIQSHFVESVQAHKAVGKAAAIAMGVDALRRMGIPDAEKRMRAYPHQFSGGMRQRVAIALSILHRPDFIIADEPTTALDVTIQEQILYEMKQLCRNEGTGMLWITHDLAVVAGLTQRIYVMYGGRIVERGPTDRIIDGARHPYTRGLIASLPEMTRRGERLQQIRGYTASPLAFERGCAFKPRCAFAGAACDETPAERPVAGSDGHFVSCFHMDKVERG